MRNLVGRRQPGTKCIPQDEASLDTPFLLYAGAGSHRGTAEGPANWRGCSPPSCAAWWETNPPGDAARSPECARVQVCVQACRVCQGMLHLRSFVGWASDVGGTWYWNPRGGGGGGGASAGWALCRGVLGVKSLAGFVTAQNRLRGHAWGGVFNTHCLFLDAAPVPSRYITDPSSCSRLVLG